MSIPSPHAGATFTKKRTQFALGYRAAGAGFDTSARMVFAARNVLFLVTKFKVRDGGMLSASGLID